MNIPVDKLIECGLSRPQAEKWHAQLKQLEAISDLPTLWKTITSQFLTPEIPFPVHELLYEQSYKKNRLEGIPCPAWYPTDDEIRDSHLGKMMEEEGVSTYEQLHRWSVSHPEIFAQRVSEKLGIQFTCPPTRYCDVSAGVEKARWYRGSRLNIVESCFQAEGHKIAIIAGDSENRLEQFSYAQLKEKTARVSNGLAELNVQPGDRIAVSLPMTVDAIAIFLGIIAAGCAVVTIADSFSAAEMAVRLEITKPKYIFIQDEIIRHSKTHPLYEKIASCQNLQAIVLRATDRKTGLREGDIEWNEFLSDNIMLKCVPRCPENETTILFSSGTTGHPKAIPWDQITPVKSASDAYFHHDIHPVDILCWPTNLGWMMGPWLVYAALINKATMAISQAVPTTRTFCEFVQKSKVTMLGLVPSIVSSWRNQEQPRQLDWTTIRRFSSTGECSNAGDMLWLMSRAGYRPVIEYCGGTETGGGYITGTLTRPAVPGLFSARTIGFDWLILDESGHEALNGEVFFIPPALGLSTRLLNRDHHEVYYAGILPGPHGEVLRQHGDQIEQLPGGYYRAHGRVDDAMNLGGIKVSSIQIEELLSKHTAVDEIAAISVSPPEGGPSSLVLFVVLHSTYDLSVLQTEMQLMIKTDLNPLFRIDSIIAIDQLPRTASNKVMRRKLREMCSARQNTAEAQRKT